MPYKPKRPCSYPGCPELTADLFCTTHTKQEAQLYERYGRDPATKKRYGRTWKRIREHYIMAHPLCELCATKKRAIPSEEVHHKRPLAQGGTNDKSNLMSLCKSCHSEITAREGGRWGAYTNHANSKSDNIV